MKDDIKNGTVREFEDKRAIYFDGYWIRHYQTNSNTLADKKQMIDLLTRRVFHNLEPGINTPGHRLDEVRSIYNEETNPEKKRVKGAMLAGSLLNRGRDILSAIVDLEDSGVKIEADNELLEQCGKCFIEALELGKNIRLSQGIDSVSEIWGEPFRVFSLPTEEFFRVRYVKIAQTMAEIDLVAATVLSLIEKSPLFAQAESLVVELAKAAKSASETLRSDSAIFEVWPEFVVARENFETFTLDLSHVDDSEIRNRLRKGHELIQEAGLLMVSMSSLRVPIPISVKKYVDKCAEYRIQPD